MVGWDVAGGGGRESVVPLAIASWKLWEVVVQGVESDCQHQTVGFSCSFL